MVSRRTTNINHFNQHKGMLQAIRTLLLLTIPFFCSGQQLLTFGSTFDEGGILINEVIVDNTNNRIIVGQISLSGPTDLDPGQDTFLLEFPQLPNLLPAFVASYNSTGALNFAFPLVDQDVVSNSVVRQLDIDDEDNIFIAGRFTGKIDLDPSEEVFELQAQSSNLSTGFLASYTSSGELRFGVKVPFTYEIFDFNDFGVDKRFQVDGEGNSYILVRAQSGGGDADPGPGVFQLDSQEKYLLCYDEMGGFLYGIHLPETSEELGVSTDGTIYVAGSVDNYLGFNHDFDPGVGVESLSDPENTSGFLVSYTSDGAFRFLNEFSGVENGILTEMVRVGNNGEVYLAGKLLNDTDFDSGNGSFVLEADSFEPDASGDLYVAKYSASGELLAATLFPDVVGQTSRELILDGFISAQGILVMAVGQQFGAVNYGTTDNPQIIESSLTGLVDEVVLHIDGTTLETFDKYRGGITNLGAPIALGKSFACDQYSIVGFTGLNFEITFNLPSPNSTISTPVDEESEDGLSYLLTIDLETQGTGFCELVNPVTTSTNDLVTYPLVVFPNPTQDKIYIKELSVLEFDTPVFLFDSFGNLVQTFGIECLADGFDIKNLPKGVYTIQFSIGKEHYVGRFVHG